MADIYLADIYRRYGLGDKLLRALAGGFGGQVADMSWPRPVCDAVRRPATPVLLEGMGVS
ncbi:hypothetical protein [Streptomyces platensis]